MIFPDSVSEKKSNGASDEYEQRIDNASDHASPLPSGIS
jgi:hypothetical protein